MKPLASISIDLDNKWSYLKTHGDAGWESLPSYLDTVVPRFLEMLDRYGLKVTVFVVGQDAALDKNQTALREIVAAGHEIGNHSFHHEPWLHLYSPEDIDRELAETETAINRFCGAQLKGFRGPGFSFSSEVLKVLINRGYEYDCSTFPTYLGPLARAYYFLRSSLSNSEKKQRNKLFGSWTEGFRPLKPYYWEHSNGQLLEIPVTTMPLVRAPIHLSYISYLAQFSMAAAKTYFATAIKLCRLHSVEPSLLLHPLDFLGCEDEPELGFFPAMNLPRDRKLAIVEFTLKVMSNTFEALPMGEYAQRIGKRRLRTKRLNSITNGNHRERAPSTKLEPRSDRPVGREIERVH